MQIQNQFVNNVRGKNYNLLRERNGVKTYSHCKTLRYLMLEHVVYSWYCSLKGYVYFVFSKLVLCIRYNFLRNL
jgi:hypothetical protein